MIELEAQSGSVTLPAALLFMDECMYAPLDLAALTALLVPLEVYSATRDGMCEIVTNALKAGPTEIPAPVELHAQDLLPGRDDPARLGALNAAVGLVNSNGLRVFRTAYLNRREMTDTIFAEDSNLYGINFFNVMSWLQDIMKTTLVLPVMDGVPGSRPDAKKGHPVDRVLIRAFAAQVRSIHHLRQYKAVRSSISIANAENLGEPTFADSTHSVLIQLVDLVSHLLLQLEREELEGDFEPSQYKEAVLACARQLNPDLICAWKGRMTMRQKT